MKQISIGLLVLLLELTVSGCATAPDAATVAKTQTLSHYLQQANHLDATQRTAMQQGRPFVGMRMEEADLSMQRVSGSEAPWGNLLRVLYYGGGANYYTVLFSSQQIIHDYFFMTDPALERSFDARFWPRL
jgi:hypothetical protein